MKCADIFIIQKAIEDRLVEIKKEIARLPVYDDNQWHEFQGQKHALWWVLEEIRFLRNATREVTP